MPGGRGVKVVNTVLFDILNVGKCFEYRTDEDFFGEGLEGVVENKVSEEDVVEVKQIHGGDKL
jgi:hypothetical protein